MHVWTLLLATPWLLFFAVAMLRLRRKPRLRDHIPGAPQPSVSIIVPARNEALNIGTCLPSLIESTYPARDIIVVNDGSSDGTGSIAREIAAGARGVTVIDNEPLPEGWVGKPWACWSGYQHARGELLLFTDADTRHFPELLDHAVAALRDTGAALVSCLPRQRMVSFWEALILPHIFLTIQMGAGSVAAINRTRNPRHVLANGQFILIRREVYERIGGHAGIRGEVVEDVRIAQRVVESGERMYLAHAHDLMETRMYRSLPDIVEGWTKNLARGTSLRMPQGTGRIVLCFAAFAGMLFWVGPPAVLLAGLLVPSLGGATIWAAVVTVLSQLFWIGLSGYQSSRPGPALLYPVGAAITSFLMLRSAFRGSHVEWRGREYRLVDH